MNIVLSQKDADFILKYIRSDLEKVSDCGDAITEKQSKIKDDIKELDIEDNCPEMMLVNGLLDMSNEMIEESKEIKNNLLKCIELLTVGSEVV